MGNSVGLNFGTVKIRVAIFLLGDPDYGMSEKYLYSTHLQGTFYLFDIDKDNYEVFIDHPILSRIPRDSQPVLASGIKHDNFKTPVENTYSIIIESVNTTQCLIRSFNYDIKHIGAFFRYEETDWRQLTLVGPGKLYTAHRANPKKIYLDRSEVLYPCLLVNLRSGISLYRINSEDDFQHIGGSSIGGSTFWALMKLMTSYSSPEEATIAALEGDNTDIDMTVGDIYGGDYNAFGLDSKLLASSCAKMSNKRPEEMRSQNIARSILNLFSWNVTQIAYMHALAEGLNRIVLIENVICLPQFMQLSQMCIDYWSQNTMKLIFTDYSAEFGAMGALLKAMERS